jgi:hypothetical protein
MMNIFKRWRERRRQRRKLRELSQIAKGFKSFDRLQQSGLLEWDSQSRRLYIDQSLALLMMKNVDTWTNFINNAFLWQYSKECDHAWAVCFQTEELKAVREYSDKLKEERGNRKDNLQLKRSDVDRIREARRREILETNMQPPAIQSFEFFIVSPPDLNGSPSPNDSVVGKLTAVGHYDPDTSQMQMALWSEVEPLIKQSTAQ